MLPCDICKQNPATVHDTLIEPPNKKVETHLCEACALKQGVIKKQVGIAISQLFGPSTAPEQKEIQELLVRKCPECGITWPEFRAKGRLGCAHDYDLFEKGLLPLLEKIHGSTEHVGKSPGHRGAELELEKELTRLKAELARLIKKEEYEKAAEVRDRIYTVERSIEGKKDAPK
jgi:protein arginine kinase activator